MPKPLYFFEATEELMTEGYVIADSKEEAEAEAKECAGEFSSSDWESYGINTSVSEVTEPNKVRKSAYIWVGGPNGRDVTLEEALRILDGERDQTARLPEIPGQESWEFSQEGLTT